MTASSYPRFSQSGYFGNNSSYFSAGSQDVASLLELVVHNVQHFLGPPWSLAGAPASPRHPPSPPLCKSPCFVNRRWGGAAAANKNATLAHVAAPLPYSELVYIFTGKLTGRNLRVELSTRRVRASCLTRSRPSSSRPALPSNSAASLA